MTTWPQYDPRLLSSESDQWPKYEPPPCPNCEYEHIRTWGQVAPVASFVTHPCADHLPKEDR